MIQEEKANEMATLLYNQYNDNLGGTEDDNNLPNWEDLSDERKNGWRSVASTILSRIPATRVLSRVALRIEFDVANNSDEDARLEEVESIQSIIDEIKGDIESTSNCVDGSVTITYIPLE